MTEAELIAKQQIEIEELKQRVEKCQSALFDIRHIMHCIPGPLNSNRDGYNRTQLHIFFRINDCIEEAIG